MIETFANFFFLGIGAVLGIFGIKWILTTKDKLNDIKIKELDLERNAIKQEVDNLDIDELIKRDNSKHGSGSSGGDRTGSGSA